MLYLAEHLPAPDRLDDLFPYINAEIAYRQQSRFTSGQRAAALLTGAAMPHCFAARVQNVFPEFPDVANVGRSAHDIEVYLSRLIAPDVLKNARQVLWDILLIDEEIHVVAADLARLSEISPDTATALLELRIGRGYSNLRDSIADLSLSRDQRDELLDLTPIAVTMTRIRIGYLLRGIAMKCAAQIHAPLNWPTLDNAEQGMSGDPLLNATMTNAVEADLHLITTLVPAYKPDETKDRKVKVGAKTEKTLLTVGLKDRGIVQRGIWQRQHGNTFHADLDAEVEKILLELPGLKDRVACHRASYSLNTLVGHLDRAKAGVRLYLAVEEAVDWFIEPVDHRLESSTRSPRQKFEPWIVTTLKSLAGPLGSDALKAPPRVHEKALTVGYLFEALRIAYLRDKGIRLRCGKDVRNPITNKLCYKAPDFQEFDRLYDFKTLFADFVSSVEGRSKFLPSENGQKTVVRPGGVDNEFKREAVTLRKHPEHAALPDTFVEQQQLRTSIMRGFEAP